MPIYQYDCEACGRRVERFYRSANRVEENPACPECGERRLQRRVSMFARVHSRGDRLEEFDFASAAGDLDDRDPASFERWARRVGSEYDDELGTNYRELAERTASGEDTMTERVDAAYTLRHRVEQARSGGDTHTHDHDHGHDHGDAL